MLLIRYTVTLATIVAMMTAWDMYNSGVVGGNLAPYLLKSNLYTVVSILVIDGITAVYKRVSG